jgi:hypothetical protein
VSFKKPNGRISVAGGGYNSIRIKATKIIFSAYKFSSMYKPEKDGIKQIVLNSQDLNAEVCWH